MVVLTIVTQKNRETVFFDEPIPKVHFMKLVSCILYNSWHKLTTVGQITLKKTGDVIASILQGHYTVGTLAKELTTSLKLSKKEDKLNIEKNKPNSVLEITQLFPINEDKIQVSHTLVRLIGSSITLNQKNYIKR